MFLHFFSWRVPQLVPTILGIFQFSDAPGGNVSLSFGGAGGVVCFDDSRDIQGHLLRRHFFDPKKIPKNTTKPQGVFKDI